jgi:hypothetical protein
MKTESFRTVVVCAVVAGFAAAATASQIFNRSAEWFPGTPGQISGSPGPTGPTPWIYEYAMGGGASNSANPWYHQPSTPMVWDSNWWGTGRGVWAQGDDLSPPVDQNRYAHNVSAIAIGAAPLVRFRQAPGEAGMYDISGNLKIVWDGVGGVGRPTPVDVILGVQDASKSSTNMLLNSTHFKPNPFASIGDYIEIPINFSNVVLGAGESLVLSHRGRDVVSPGGWITMYDNVTITLIPAPGALALLGLGGLVATRRRR